VLFGQALAGAPWLSPLPTWEVFLAHVLLLQDVLGIDSLSAGAWYVAIDLQLFALLATLVWVCRRGGRELAASAAPALVALLTGAAALVFNHQQRLDVWAIYFFSAYGLGALTAWASADPRARRWWLLGLALVLLDWLLAPRERPLWTLATVVALYASTRLPSLAAPGAWLRRATHGLADLSYSVFVCHFAAIVLASGLWQAWQLKGLPMAWAITGLGWLLALALALGVHALCERTVAPVRRRLAA